MHSAGEKLDDIRSGKNIKFGIISDVSRNLFYLCLILLIIFGVWGISTEFTGWKLYGFVGSIIVGVVFKLIERNVNRRM